MGWPIRVAVVGLGAAVILVAAVESIRWVNEVEAAKRAGEPVPKPFTFRTPAAADGSIPAGSPSASTVPSDATVEAVRPRATTAPKAASAREIRRAARDAEAGTPRDENRTAGRLALLRQLTVLYINDHDGISPQMMAGLELPPAGWLNTELEKLRANWRVRSVNGPNAETYDVKPTPKQPEAENGFGQNGIMDIGEATEPVVEEANGLVKFRAMFTDWRFDPKAPFVFRHFSLRITHSDAPQKLETMGVKTQIVENVTAEIVSRR
jgi:hypothetical protein